MKNKTTQEQLNNKLKTEEVINNKLYKKYYYKKTNKNYNKMKSSNIRIERLIKGIERLEV